MIEAFCESWAPLKRWEIDFNLIKSWKCHENFHFYAFYQITNHSASVSACFDGLAKSNKSSI